MGTWRSFLPGQFLFFSGATCLRLVSSFCNFCLDWKSVWGVGDHECALAVVVLVVALPVSLQTDLCKKGAALDRCRLGKQKYILLWAMCFQDHLASPVVSTFPQLGRWSPALTALGVFWRLVLAECPWCRKCLMMHSALSLAVLPAGVAAGVTHPPWPSLAWSADPGDLLKRRSSPSLPVSHQHPQAPFLSERRSVSKLPLPTALKSKLVLPRPWGRALQLPHLSRRAIQKRKVETEQLRFCLRSCSSLRADSWWVAVCPCASPGCYELGLCAPSYSALLNWLAQRNPLRSPSKNLCFRKNFWKLTVFE